MSWLWLLLPLALLVMGLAFYLSIRSGVLWEGLSRAASRAVGAIWRMLLPKLLKPASPEELAAIKKADDRGNERDRLNKGSGRPFGRGKE